MISRLPVAVLLLAASTPAAAADARLELHAGAGWRDDTLTRAPVTATATGAAFSELGLRAVWFPSAHLGLAAHGRAGRFTLTPVRGVSIPDHVDQTSLDAGGALAARASLPWLTAEAHLGYAFLRVPVMSVVTGPAGDARFAGGAMRTHGPRAAAALHLALGTRVRLELGGEARPWLFGARYEGAAVDVRRLGARGGLVVDCCDLGRTRWSLLAGYELSDTRTRGGGTVLEQTGHQLELGLTGRWLPPPPPPPPPPPRPVVRPPPPPPPGAISGVVLGEGGRPLDARVSLNELAMEVRADGQGAFRFDVRPGIYTLTVEAEGYLPQTKVITVGSGEQHIYNLELQKEAP